MKIHTNKKNLRQGESRGVGVNLAAGKYIWFIDQDDFIEKNVAAKLINYLEINNLDILSFNYYYYLNNETKTPILPLPADTEVITGKQYVELLPGINYEQANWRKIFKRDFLLQNNLRFASCASEDTYLSMQTNYYAQRIKHINSFDYFYRNNSNSQINNIDTQYNIRIFYYISEYFLFYEKIKTEDQYFANKVKISALGDLNYAYKFIPHFTNPQRKQVTSYIEKYIELINESGFFTGKKAKYFRNFRRNNCILNIIHPLYVLKRKAGRIKRKILNKNKK
jgi:hypothetical protein